MSHSPILFESDDENADYYVETAEPTIEVPVEERPAAVVKDETCVRNLRSILKGVPPPPNYTSSEQNSASLLVQYYENSKILGVRDEATPMEVTSVELPPSVPEAISPPAPDAGTEVESNPENGCKNSQFSNFGASWDVPQKNPSIKNYTSVWPDVRLTTFFDIYYNLGSISEELSSLLDRFRERYIGCETTSSFVSRSPVLTASAKKRARRRAWGGYSPGRRLSHLAQRRRTFSSANLSLYSTNSNGRALLPGTLHNTKSAVTKKMVLVDGKSKNSQKSKSTSRIRDTSQPNVSKPSGSMPKRALFQSPDQITKNSARKFLRSTPNKSRGSKRALWPSSSDKKNRNSAKKVTPIKTVIEDSDEEIPSEEINANGKRLSTSSDSVQVRKKCQKSLNFSSDNNPSVDEEMPKEPTKESSSKQQNHFYQQLSQLHKQKMVWAVASSLKQCGINTSHELFRPAGTVLFKKCRQVWLHLLNNRTSDIKRSTSEQMFEIAIRYTPETVKKLKSARVPSISSDNLVNIKSVSGDEKSKSVGFSKVSDIFFSVKSSQSSQEEPSEPKSSDDRNERDSCPIKSLTEVIDTNSNSLSRGTSSDASWIENKAMEKGTEVSNQEFSNSTTDDSIERQLRLMFDRNNQTNVDGTSNISQRVPRIFDEDSQISQFNISDKIPAENESTLGIDKLSCNSAFNKPVRNCDMETNIDHSIRNFVSQLKVSSEGSENDSGFIDNECGVINAKSLLTKSCESPDKAHLSDVKLTKNVPSANLCSPTSFAMTSVGKESIAFSCNRNKENRPLKSNEVAPPAPSDPPKDNGTFQFKKFGLLYKNAELNSKKDQCEKIKADVVNSVHFDETAMNACDVSIDEP